MTYTKSAKHVPLRILALLFLLAMALAPRAAFAQSAALDQQLTTSYFTIHYPASEQQTAEYYANLVDQVDESISALLGSPPISGIQLYIYDTAANYEQANPLAQNEPGVVAASIPADKAIALAAEQLRQVDPTIAASSFRHELTHIVAGVLSNQQLLIGFQEGLAQYDELSTTRSQSVVALLQQEQSSGHAYLTWEQLTDTTIFRDNINLSYAESYSVMAFLADRYGMGDYVNFLAALRNGAGWEDGLRSAYGYSVEDLQQQWQDYLPSFLSNGWLTNVLEDFDLGSSIALYQAGQFAAANNGFTRSEKLYNDLGRSDLAAQAQSYLTKSQKAHDASNLANQARSELQLRQYDAASSDALQAASVFSGLQLDSVRQSANATARLAQQGLTAQTEFAAAQGAARMFNFSEATAQARAAGADFAAVGDSDAVSQVNALLDSIANGQRFALFIALGLGTLTLLAGAVVALARRLRGQAAHYLREESAPWL